MKKGLIFALFLLLVLPLASAEIIISQPKAVYNIGDAFSGNITLIPSSATQDFFVAKLVCDNGEVEILKSPEKLSAGQSKSISINTEFDDFLIGNLSGQCFIRGLYGGDSVDGQRFELTNSVDVSLSVDGVVFGPGDRVSLSGKAVKANGNLLKGFVEISVLDTNLSFFGAVDKGVFAIAFNILDNAKPGSYTINAKAYEKDSNGNIINSGEAENILKIKQVVSSLGVAFNSNTITPGSELDYTVTSYDQAGDAVEGQIPVVIQFPDKSVFLNKLVNSGDANALITNNSYTPGYWKVIATLNGISEEKIFYIEEVETANFVMDNGTLLITNTGNVPYAKPVEVSIGGVKQVKEVSLGIGDSQRLKLLAPDGQYAIGVSDGNSSSELGSVFLTGNAISVTDLKNSILSSDKILWVWIFVIVILLAVVYYFYRKNRNKAYYGSSPTSLDSSVRLKKAESFAPVVPKEVGDSLESNRQQSCVISLKIKNSAQIKGDSDALGAVDRALMKAKESKAKIYVDGDYRIIVLAPVLTKQSDNMMPALRIAKDMEQILSSYNMNKKVGVDFGIGINLGEMIAEFREGRIKFTAIGNTIVIAKRTSEFAQKEVLLSDNFHDRLVGKIKTEKTQSGYWRVTKVPSRENYNDFVQRFLDRQKNPKSF